MTTGDRIKNWKLHDSQRGWFGFELYKAMAKDPKIWLISIDLGYGLFDKHFKYFPERTINTGAAEQAAMGIACGLALEGKIPVVYSISTFLLFRAFEQIRNYINHEKIPVKLIGGGRAKDYEHDGISHWMFEDDIIFRKIFKNIRSVWPEYKEDIPDITNTILMHKRPYYMNLKR